MLYPTRLNGDTNMVTSQDPQDEIRRLFQRAEHLCSPSLPAKVPSSPPLLQEMDLSTLVSQAQKLAETGKKTLPPTLAPPLCDAATCETESSSPAKQQPSFIHPKETLQELPTPSCELSSSTSLPRAYTHLVSFIAAAFLLLFGSYFCLDYLRTKEELSAARQTADLGMALSYAKVASALQPDATPLAPNFDNLKAWVSQVVSPGLATPLFLNENEPYEHLPYQLHLLALPPYTDFLVCAEPVPSWADWLRPRKSWVVFSGDLCLHYARHPNEMAMLHQIASGQLSLETASSFFETLPVLPLQKLDFNKSQGFIVPTALHHTSGKAGVYLYNAPRYHPFSQGLAKAAKELSVNPDSPDHLEALFEQASLYQTFPQLVVYNEEGTLDALDLQLTFHEEPAIANFPIGYVALEEGAIKSSHLVQEPAWAHTLPAKNPYLEDLQSLVDAHWKELGVLQQTLSLLFDSDHLRAQDLFLREQLLANYVQAHQEAKLALAEAIADLYLEIQKEGEQSTSLLISALLEASLFPFLQEELNHLDVLDFGTIASLTVLSYGNNSSI